LHISNGRRRHWQSVRVFCERFSRYRIRDERVSAGTTTTTNQPSTGPICLENRNIRDCTGAGRALALSSWFVRLPSVVNRDAPTAHDLTLASRWWAGGMRFAFSKDSNARVIARSETIYLHSHSKIPLLPHLSSPTTTLPST
jgi:hypothetical protein